MGNRVQAEMPRYRSHKVVYALKIQDIAYPEPSSKSYDGSAWIVPEEKGFAQFKVNASYVGKHNPQPGGYYVIYKDGYASWSPAKAFEEGYERI